MQSTGKAIVLLAAAVLTASASDSMPVTQQNALVKKHCAVCHTDAVRNGGLSLEHFDAAQTAPSLAAMLVSKLQTGAMGAAGLPIPDEPTVSSLVDTLSHEAQGANEWHVNRVGDVEMTASILRELPSERNAGRSVLYRLVLECNATTGQGRMQLAWAPAPARGSLSAVVDGGAPVTYQVEGVERMGNGSAGTTGPAAISLYDSVKGSQTLPKQTLRIANLFPNEAVEFPFNELSQSARQSLGGCFAVAERP